MAKAPAIHMRALNSDLAACGAVVPNRLGAVYPYGLRREDVTCKACRRTRAFDGWTHDVVTITEAK